MNKTQLFSFIAGVLVGLLLALLFNSIYLNKPPKETKEITECPKIEQPPKTAFDNTLSAPVFTEDSPDVFVTNEFGEVRVGWNKVRNATEYRIKIYTMDGRLIKNWKTKVTTVFLKNIPIDKKTEFTYHKLSIAAVNSNGAEGPQSEKREVKSKRAKNIMAPKIESITVED